MTYIRSEYFDPTRFLFSPHILKAEGHSLLIGVPSLHLWPFEHNHLILWVKDKVLLWANKSNMFSYGQFYASRLCLYILSIFRPPQECRPLCRRVVWNASCWWPWSHDLSSASHMHSEGKSTRYIPHMSAKDSDTARERSQKRRGETNVYFVFKQNAFTYY